MRARLGWVLLAVVVATTGRLPALLHQGAIDDEAIYAVVGHVMVDGGLPYLNAIERKPPLLFVVYEAIFQCFGKFNWPALHLVALAWVLLTMAGLYVIGRRLFSPRAGYLAALLYSIYQPWGTWKDLAFNGEVLMNLPLVWAFVLALGPARLRSRPALFLSGVLVAAAALLKQPAAIAVVPLGLYVVLPSYRASRGYTWADSTRHVLMLAGGLCATLGSAAAVMSYHGILDEALYWTVTNHQVEYVLWLHALEHSLGFVLAALPLLLPVMMPRLLGTAWSGRLAEGRAMLFWAGVSLIGTSAGGRFYPHYYIQLIPPLAILSGAVYARIKEGASVPHPWLTRPRVTYAWLALTVAVFLAIDWVGLARSATPTEAGRYVREHSLPGERIFVWGQAPAIYLEAERAPASRYIATFPLTGYIFGVHRPGLDTSGRVRPDEWSKLRADLAANPPAFLVDYEVMPDAAYPLERFPFLVDLVAKHYQLAVRLGDSVIYRRGPEER